MISKKFQMLCLASICTPLEPTHNKYNLWDNTVYHEVRIDDLEFDHVLKVVLPYEHYTLFNHKVTFIIYPDPRKDSWKLYDYFMHKN